MPGRKKKIKPSDKLAKTNKELLAEKKLNKIKHKEKVKIRKVKIRKGSTTQTKARPKEKMKSKARKKEINNREMETKLDREKQLIIFSGVTFFMVLIAFFWIINVSQVFEKMSIAQEDDNDLAGTWQELSEGLGQRLDQMKVNLEKIDELKDNLIAEQYNSTATEKLPSNDLGSTTEDEITEEQVEKLKEILENN
ncbi:hypothetical protein KAJ89_03855 [Candidatus Parcubacteria bacterium]|nr:hypothetical protein [Candidatus Parcubacteria bacterium]